MMTKMKHIILSIFVLWNLSACDRKSEGSIRASLLITKTIEADAETDALKHRSSTEDAADDPAIWYNSKKPSESRIIGTDKKGGLAVYNLEGKELFYYADGKINNVDVRQQIKMGDKTIDIAACSNRTTNTIDVYQINTNGSLKPLGEPITVKMSDEVYGFSLAQNKTKTQTYAFVNSISGKVEQWELIFNSNGLSSKWVRSIQLESKTEGMVADDALGVIFIGEEEKGIWKLKINPEKELKLELLAQSAVLENKNIYEDIEGLSLYCTSNDKGYLIASSQGNYSYAVFDRKAPHNYKGSFRIVDGKYDGSEETDGLDISNLNMGPKFPKGLMVVQDGYNKENGKSVAQNFKIVKWEKIAALFKPKLEIHSTDLLSKK